MVFLSKVAAAAMVASTAFVSALAPLEPPDGKVLFGAWYDRIQGDTPAAITQRIGNKHMSVWQSDVNMTSAGLQMPDQFISQVSELKTDAILYLTVYPIDGFDVVTDSVIGDLCKVVGDLTKGGRQVFLRYASEMNGPWFKYGQQPTKFLASWKKVADQCRANSDITKLALVWAPNSGDGYPWQPTDNPPPLSSFPDGAALDTNGDGNYTIADDPFKPFWPGDDYVDWVGLSIYHYGFTYPWVNNTLPPLGRARDMIAGNALLGNKFPSVYEYYCVPPSNKPFMISETGVAYHMEIFKGQFANPGVANNPGPGRVAMKQAWWRELFNSSFLTEFPKMKAIGLFEFMKYEEDTLRDFTNLGAHPGTRNPFDPPAAFDAVRDAFLKDLPNFENIIVWANVTDNLKATPTNTTAAQPSGQPPASAGPNKNSEVALRGGVWGIVLAVVVAVVGYKAVF